MPQMRILDPGGAAVRSSGSSRPIKARAVEHGSVGALNGVRSERARQLTTWRRCRYGEFELIPDLVLSGTVPLYDADALTLQLRTASGPRSST
jgi:hypothetical protein